MLRDHLYLEELHLIVMYSLATWIDGGKASTGAWVVDSDVKGIIAR
jgi:hypothetical protein